MGSSESFVLLFQLAVMIVAVAGFWKMLTKAGQPGWSILVPFYNMYVLLEVAGKPTWWILLMLIPFINIIMFLIVYVAVAERFGKGAGFGVGLAFLSPIFAPILGFGDAQYHPPEPRF